MAAVAAAVMAAPAVVVASAAAPVLMAAAAAALAAAAAPAAVLAAPAAGVPAAAVATLAAGTIRHGQHLERMENRISIARRLAKNKIRLEWLPTLPLISYRKLPPKKYRTARAGLQFGAGELAAGAAGGDRSLSMAFALALAAWLKERSASETIRPNKSASWLPGMHIFGGPALLPMTTGDLQKDVGNRHAPGRRLCPLAAGCASRRLQ
jgi:hypothetical protein